MQHLRSLILELKRLIDNKQMLNDDSYKRDISRKVTQIIKACDHLMKKHKGEVAEKLEEIIQSAGKIGYMVPKWWYAFSPTAAFYGRTVHPLSSSTQKEAIDAYEKMIQLITDIGQILKIEFEEIET